MRWVLCGLILLLAACGSGGGTGGQESPVTASPTSANSPSPSPSVDPGAWTAENEEEAAAVIADGIRKKHPLELRMEAGRCTVDRMQDPATVAREARKVERSFGGLGLDVPSFATYDEWNAVETDNSDSVEAAFANLVLFGILGKCELEVGL